MKINVRFKELNQKFNPRFGELHEVSDGGYDRGYAAGYEKGEQDGLSARQHETWTITLVDGTVIEKDVALL